MFGKFLSPIHPHCYFLTAPLQLFFQDTLQTGTQQFHNVTSSTNLESSENSSHRSHFSLPISLVWSLSIGLSIRLMYSDIGGDFL